MPQTPQDSPPLMRGMRASAVACTRTPRLTSANAGNTRPAGQRSLFPVTHPRLRGEYPVGFPSLHSSSDSPPLARGIRRASPHRAERKGLTPAGAGNTSAMAHGRIFRKTHPRWRGEYLVVLPGTSVAWTHPRWRGECPMRIVQVYGPKDPPPLTRGILNAGYGHWPHC